MPITNRDHGCGYVKPDGTIGPTYDIFATREFMRRLYVLTRQRRPDGQLNIHNSTVMVIPHLGVGHQHVERRAAGQHRPRPRVPEADAARCLPHGDDGSPVRRAVRSSSATSGRGRRTRRFRSPCSTMSWCGPTAMTTAWRRWRRCGGRWMRSVATRRAGFPTGRIAIWSARSMRR